MSLATPMTTALKAELARNSKLKAWQLRTVRRSGFQTYLVKTQLESERWVENLACEATVFVANGDKLGRAVVTLRPEESADFAARVDEAAYMASLGGDSPWELPRAGSWPKVQMHDPALAGAKARTTSQAIVETWRGAVGGKSDVRPSSMELFCGEEQIALENSAGLTAEAATTRVSMLTLLLADGERASERYSWEERRRAADLDVAGIVTRAADEARDLTRATPPPSGKYPVLIDGKEIAAFLTPIQNNASAATLYQKSSRFEVGKPLPVESGGEPLTVYSNATVPYGLGSYAFDGDGVPGARVEIVKDGVFAKAWATKQFSDYLKVPVTGQWGNLEIPAGKTPLADLRSGDGPILYVREFSWLTPDQARGNFGTEVRFGYLYEKGVRRPVKGGTVSGSVFGALATARMSRETAFLGDYLGPTAIRFDNLTVAGS